MSTPLLRLTQALLSQPTAPFHEEAVRAAILAELALLPHVGTQLDAFGNVIALFQRGDQPPRFAFGAHMDHPAFVSDPEADSSESARIFLGGVPEPYRAKKPPTRDFGQFAMWDLPAFAFQDGRIFSRACDDLIGCVAILAMFQALEASDQQASVYGLFTRAEEVGFVGAIHLAKAHTLPDSVSIISLETSSERGGACKMGDGVIVRVGDKTSIFDPTLTAQLVQLAKAANLPFQRALMSGGTCEATAYQLYGYRTAALCVALGNYHNCGPEERIESEFVSLADVEAMIALCVAIAQGAENENVEVALRERLEQGIEKHRRFFPPDYTGGVFNTPSA